MVKLFIDFVSLIGVAGALILGVLLFVKNRQKTEKISSQLILNFKQIVAGRVAQLVPPVFPHKAPPRTTQKNCRLLKLECQSALEWAPRSASKRDPLFCVLDD